MFRTDPSSKSGKCNFNKEVQSYKKRLKIINIRMKKIINHIINFDKNSIIIILGDHGPSFLNNCGLIDSKKLSHKVQEFLLDNYGAFLAYRFPDGSHPKILYFARNHIYIICQRMKSLKTEEN